MKFSFCNNCGRIMPSILHSSDSHVEVYCCCVCGTFNFKDKNYSDDFYVALCFSQMELLNNKDRIIEKRIKVRSIKK